jgi:hypothetical protein
MKKAYVVSPVEPSGASWLLNCLLELELKVGHKPCVDTVWRNSRPRPPADYVWQERGGRFFLRRKAELLEKWLPACSRRAEFTFRSGVAVDYVQDFPAAEHEARPVIYVVRDPRDAMYSMYRRVAPEMSCLEYVRFPNARSLLSRIDHWGRHVRAWAEHPRVRFVRFEDYKHDARAALAEVLDFLEVEADPGAVDHAVEESTFDKAARGERRYRDSYPQDEEVINRSGRVGDWRGRPELVECAAFIESRVDDLLARFRYEPEDAGRLASGGGVRDGRPSDADPLAAAVLFTDRLDEDLLRRSRLPPGEVMVLLDSLDDLLRTRDGRGRDRVAGLRSRLAEGSPYHFERLGQLRTRLSRRQRGPDATPPAES